MSDIAHKLAQEVVNLGRDDKERAAALGCSPRTITDYKAGKFPRVVLALLERQIVVLQGSASVAHQDAA